MIVSADLYRFIGGLSVDGTGKVIENELDKKSTYVSKHFTPNLQVSQVSIKVKSDITLDLNNVYNNTSDPNSLVYMLQHSTLAVLVPDIYRYCQAVILDFCSIVYAYESEPVLLMDLTTEDFDNTINNCLYLADYFSGKDEYSELASRFTEAVVKLGVLKNGISELKAIGKETVSAYGTV